MKKRSAEPAQPEQGDKPTKARPSRKAAPASPWPADAIAWRIQRVEGGKRVTCSVHNGQTGQQQDRFDLSELPTDEAARVATIRQLWGGGAYHIVFLKRAGSGTKGGLAGSLPEIRINPTEVPPKPIYANAPTAAPPSSVEPAKPNAHGMSSKAALIAALAGEGGSITVQMAMSLVLLLDQIGDESRARANASAAAEVERARQMAQIEIETIRQRAELDMQRERQRAAERNAETQAYWEAMGRVRTPAAPATPPEVSTALVRLGEQLEELRDEIDDRDDSDGAATMGTLAKILTFVEKNPKALPGVLEGVGAAVAAVKEATSK